MNFEHWYNKNYKKLLILPAAILLISIIYITAFYVQTGDIINKDVSLTGGTTITIQTQISQQDLENTISQTITDFEIKTISDNSGNQIQLIITVNEQNAAPLETILEEFLGYELTTENNVSKETTSASLSADFYKQLIVAILIAFFWMAAVVFIIFSKGAKTKF